MTDILNSFNLRIDEMAYFIGNMWNTTQGHLSVFGIMRLEVGHFLQ